MQAATATFTSISECLTSFPSTNAVINGESAFCIEAGGDCSTSTKQVKIFCSEIQKEYQTQEFQNHTIPHHTLGSENQSRKPRHKTVKEVVKLWDECHSSTLIYKVISFNSLKVFLQCWNRKSQIHTCKRRAEAQENILETLRTPHLLIILVIKILFSCVCVCANLSKIRIRYHKLDITASEN